MSPPKILSVPARTRRKGGVGGIPPCSCKKQRPAPPPALSGAEASKKVFFSFYLPAEASAQAGKKKSGARKSGKAKNILLGGER